MSYQKLWKKHLNSNAASYDSFWHHKLKSWFSFPKLKWYDTISGWEATTICKWVQHQKMFYASTLVVTIKSLIGRYLTKFFGCNIQTLGCNNLTVLSV